MNKEFVNDWMTREVITITPETTLPKAHKLMIEEEIRRLPVVDKRGHVAGIVTLGDVRGAEPSSATSLTIWELNYLLAKLTVEEIMTRNPITIAPEASVGEAARVMLDNHIAGLPVLDEQGKLVGIITESDIFRMVVRHEWSESEPVPA